MGRSAIDNAVCYFLPSRYSTFPSSPIFRQPLHPLDAIAVIRLILPGRRINVSVLPSQHGRSGSGVWTFLSSDWTSILGPWVSTCFSSSVLRAVRLFNHRHIVCMPASFIYPWIFSIGVLRVFFSPVFRGLDLRFILCSSHCCHHYSYPNFSIYTPPIRLTFSLCSIICPLWFVSSWTFVYLRL